MEGNFKNHSMRKSTCTRLFRKGVDPQLIKEQTGHKSEAVMLYKKSNLQQKKEVSDMLSVLPREMEEIRASQSVMLDREEMFEKKESLLQLLVVLRGLLKSPRQRGMLIRSLKKVPIHLLRRGCQGRIKARCQAKCNFRQIQGFRCPCTCYQW